MNTCRWMLVVSVLATLGLATCPAAAADPPPLYDPPPSYDAPQYGPPPYLVTQPCAGIVNAFFGCYRPYPYYYGGPLSGATYERYYGDDWSRPNWRRPRYHRMER